MIDDHCHPFATSGGRLDLSLVNLDTTAGAEAERQRQAAAPWRTSHELLKVRLARRLSCNPDELAEAREEASRDWSAYVASLFRDAGLDQLVMDTDYPPGAEAQIETYAALAGCPVHRVMRIDPPADKMIGSGASAREVLAAVETAMTEGAQSGVVAFKTVPGYRTGLDVAADVSEWDADISLAEQVPVPRRGKACRDWVLRRALGIAAELGLPVQIHSGFGDSDMRLRESNPLLLEELLRTAEGSAAAVLLMVGYPWHEELAYLTATKPNVHADLSMFNLYSPVTLADRLLRTVDLAPASKLLLGTDGYAEPEIYWFGSMVQREAWAQVATALGRMGCRKEWLRGVERMVFEENARRFYQLPAGEVPIP